MREGQKNRRAVVVPVESFDEGSVGANLRKSSRKDWRQAA